jgi:hypothetical protein
MRTLKLESDESKGNPMVVALADSGCPIHKICCYVVVGPGTIGKQCEYFVNADSPACRKETVCGAG